MSTKTANASGDWNLAAHWTPNGVPSATDSVSIPAGITVSTVNADAPSALVNQSGGTVTVSGSLLLMQDGSSGWTESFANVTVAAGGVFYDGDPTNTASPAGDTLIIYGTLKLYGTLGMEAGTAESGNPRASLSVTTLWIYNGAALLNYNPTMWSVAAWITAPAHTPTAWTIRQYVDLPPPQFTLVSVQAWTDVAIDGNLGGIELLTTDYTGNAQSDPLMPPVVFVYRNGALWNGAINVAWKAPGSFSVDLSFADGVWQLGDHGQIRIFWSQQDADGNPQWFCQVYYWLVNRLNYETWQRVTTALPNAAPGATGGLARTQDVSPIVNITTENTIINS